MTPRIKVQYSDEEIEGIRQKHPELSDSNAVRAETGHPPLRPGAPEGNVNNRFSKKAGRARQKLTKPRPEK